MRQPLPYQHYTGENPAPVRRRSQLVPSGVNQPSRAQKKHPGSPIWPGAQLPSTGARIRRLFGSFLHDFSHALDKFSRGFQMALQQLSALVQLQDTFVQQHVLAITQSQSRQILD